MYNPWIRNPAWEGEDLHLRRHRQAAYQRPSLPFDSSPGIHTLLGPRRVGKTTQFKLWIAEQLKRGVAPQEVLYLDAERFESWKDLLEALERQNFSRVKLLFIDEVTAAQDWTRALKILADSGVLVDVCVWLTGSNAFDLKNAGERLPGRRGRGMALRDLELLPISFREFRAVVQKHHPRLSDRSAFDQFCLWGGYPMSVSECLTRSEPSFDLMQELLDVVLGETSRRHRSPRLSASLAERLWLQLGGRSSYHSLARSTDAGSHPIVRQYIEILEACYSVIQVERLNPKTKTGMLKKEKKYYFFDPMVMGALVSWVRTGSVQTGWFKEQWSSPVIQGHWIENVVAAELRKHGKTPFYDEQFGAEVDFVFPENPGAELRSWRAIEVKRSMPSSAELVSLRAYPKSEAWVYDLDEKETVIAGIPIRSLVAELGKGAV